MINALITHIQKLTAQKEIDVRQLNTYFSTQHVHKKEILQVEGERCKKQYFVEKGCLRMYYLTDRGTEQTIQFALENWWISDYLAFERQGISQFYIQAVEGTSVLAIDYPSQERLLSDIPIMERYFRLIYQRAYAASQIRMKFLTDFSKEESYKHFSNSFPDFVSRIPQQMLASYLQMTPEYLSEIKRRTSE